MPKRKPEERAPLPPMDTKLRLQREEGERRRQEYLATLDPKGPE